MPTNRRMFAPHEVIDLRRLQEIRTAKGFTQTAIAKAMGIHPSTYRSLEDGKNSLLLYHFRQLCIILELNPFDICDILRLPIFNRHHIRHFKAACKRLGQSPTQALEDFMLTFIKLAKENQT